jgi:Tol biopolymer transport system component
MNPLDVQGSAPDHRLLDVAAALADGSAVEWPTPDSVDLETRDLLDRLRSIHRVSEAFRRASTPGEDEPERADARPAAFTWGHLQVLERLGGGGFGEVYRAWDPVVDREVALKLLRPDISTPDLGNIQIDEARRLARIRHPNVLTVYGAAVHDGRPGLWSDCIAGATLERLLEERGAFGAGEVVAVGLDLCRALAALHGAGIVHGDVKPANVMRETGGRIVLMDLGAGRQVSAKSGPVYGTRSSAADEVLAGNPPTPSSDLYSLGALLFRLLTGRHHRNDATGHAGPRQPVLSLRDLRPDISSTLSAVVERALARDPASRFPSAGAMGEALQHVLRDEPDPAGAVRQRPGLTSRRAGVAVAVAGGTIATAWLALTFLPGRAALEGNVLRVTGLQPFATSLGSASHAALSPDGRRVALISDDDGTPEVWVQDVAGGAPRRLTDENVYVNQPAWSPDGSRILFTTWGTIRTVSPEGGAAVTVLDDAWNPSVGRLSGRLVFERREEVWSADLDGGNARKIPGIPERDHRVSERLPTLSPDESLIALVHAVDRPWGDVWIVPSEGGPARPITTDAKAMGRPAWSADGRTIVFASRAAGTLTLWQVDVERALRDGPLTPTRLLEGDGEDTAPTVSSDGGTLLFTVARSSYSIAMLDPESHAERTLRESPLQLLSPVVSRDGRRIAFFGWGRDGGMHVYTMDTAGGHVLQVTPSEGTGHESTFPIWSADDRELFFYRDRPEPSWRRVSADGGESVAVREGWSVPERHIVRLDAEGGQGVYTWQERDVPRVTRLFEMESSVEREFHRLLRYPSFTPDGRSIVGVDVAQSTARRFGPLVVCPIAGGPCRPLAPDATHSRVSADGLRVYFQRPIQSRRSLELWSVGMDGSDARRLWTFATESAFLPAFDLTPSGAVVISRYDRGRQEQWLAGLASGPPH